MLPVAMSLVVALLVSISPVAMLLVVLPAVTVLSIAICLSLCHLLLYPCTGILTLFCCVARIIYSICVACGCVVYWHKRSLVLLSVHPSWFYAEVMAPCECFCASCSSILCLLHASSELRLDRWMKWRHHLSDTLSFMLSRALHWQLFSLCVCECVSVHACCDNCVWCVCELSHSSLTLTGWPCVCVWGGGVMWRIGDICWDRRWGMFIGV